MSHSTRPGQALALDDFPPESIEIEELCLRRPSMADLEAFHNAAVASFAQLNPWMSWCTKPLRIEDRRGFIERAADKWAAQTAFHWFISDADTRYLGTVSLMDSIGPGALEIGYWLRTEATGRGIMTRCVTRVTALALALPGIERVEIRCDAANVRSAAIPRKLGYRMIRQVFTEPGAPGECGVEEHWVTP
ncbi:GNAT family N-acetyltransferase [Actinospica sp. MGRD01-02]|uniref:GNAT family N-acetyltransferase n=1 Tax=Actinospica acidithermotolerans TaxID=2828514 RepID=A0A941IH57_9ACTN|nr:GNAT family N-acetyltransferase [Actinospica acidithermotolerans]MBR7828165.1 GNAT family N-acetyltransferase [Actinospica acidithermotolerans]